MIVSHSFGTVPWRVVLGPSRRLAGQRMRRIAVPALAGAGAALLLMGFWMPAKAALAQVLLNRAWIETADGRAEARPWPWADTWPVARLSLPTQSEPLTVLAGASGRNLAFAPALMDGSAPLGTPGVSVIAAHRDTHFRALAKLALGDHFEIELPDGARIRYEIRDIEVIDARRTSVRLDAEGSVVVLVTCYPFDAVVPGGSMRYTVTGYAVRGS